MSSTSGRVHDDSADILDTRRRGLRRRLKRRQKSEEACHSPSKSAASAPRSATRRHDPARIPRTPRPGTVAARDMQISGHQRGTAPRSPNRGTPSARTAVSGRSSHHARGRWKPPRRQERRELAEGCVVPGSPSPLLASSRNWMERMARSPFIPFLTWLPHAAADRTRRPRRTLGALGASAVRFQTRSSRRKLDRKRPCPALRAVIRHPS